jgi:hypothetical protein
MLCSDSLLLTHGRSPPMAGRHNGTPYLVCAASDQANRHLSGSRYASRQQAGAQSLGRQPSAEYRLLCHDKLATWRCFYYFAI